MHVNACTCITDCINLFNKFIIIFITIMIAIVTYCKLFFDDV